MERGERGGVDDWLFGLGCYACAGGGWVVGDGGHWCVHDAKFLEVGLEIGGVGFGLVLDGGGNKVLVVKWVHVIVCVVWFGILTIAQ